MFLSALELMLRRSLSHWKLLSAVIIGVMLAVSIMSATVLYFDALRNIALQHDLDQHGPSTLDILVEAKQSPVDRESHEEFTDFVSPRLDRYLGPIADGISVAYKSSTFYIAGEGHEVPPPSDDRRRASFVVVEGIEDNAILVSGRWPQITAKVSGDSVLIVEGAISEATAAEFGLSVGDQFEMAPFWEARHERVIAGVTGVYARTEPDSRFWRTFDEALGFGSTSFQFATFAIPERSMLEALGDYFPLLTSEYGWLIDFDASKLKADQSGVTQVAMDQLESEFDAELDGFRITTGLDRILNTFEARLFFNKIPMFVVMVLIVFVVLYYVSTIAGLLMDVQKEEIALLRSRGGTGRQIILVYSAEAFALSAIAIPLGPYIASFVIGNIGVMPWFDDLNGGNALPTNVTATVFRMSAIGGVLSLLALLVPSIQAGRMGMLEHRMASARPARLPAFQRYYLDLGLMGLVLFLFWQLQQRGSFVATSIFGDENVNQLILAVPAVFLIAAGIVLLRLFPISMEILGRFLSSRLMSPITSPALVLGVWQMARNPAHHARLSLLLILTASLGVFAATFAGTLDQSFIDRVFYETGADVRVLGIRLPENSRGRSVAVEEMIRTTDGVTGITPVIRGGGSLISDATVHFDYVGVDSETFGEVGWTRDDFGPRPISDGLERLDLEGRAGLVIPEGATSLFATVRPFEANSSVNILARVSDAEDRIFTLNMGSTGPNTADSGLGRCPKRENPSDPPPWCTVGGSISLLGVTGGAPEPPYILEFLSVAKLNDQEGSGGLRSGAMVIDNIGVRMNDGRDLLLEDFDDLAAWGSLGLTLTDLGGTIAPYRDSTGAPIPGQARFSWGDAGLRELQGVLAGKLRQAVPILASEEFLDQSGFKVGDEVDILMENREVLIKIVDKVTYFPTLDPGVEAFVVADIQSSWRALGIDRLGDARRVDEYWVATDPLSEITAADIEQIVSRQQIRFAQVEERVGQLGQRDVDPLSAAGWRALLAIAFFTVLVVSAIGFLVHAQVTFQGRRMEFALLRASGLSMKQLLGLVLLEQVLVISAAFAIGAFMGARLGNTIMPFLGTSGSGLDVVPPMAQQINWQSFGITFGIIGVVFAGVIATLLWMVFKMSIHSVMRMGER
jgi:hypothetical protein